jgi:nucleoside-diphosphate-sugar epimerase
VDFTARHIFLTGGTGFLGRQLLPRLLAAGHRIRALYRPGTAPAELPYGPAVEWVAGDLLAIESLEANLDGIEAIVHAAGLVSYQREDRDLLFLTNETGTANLVNAALYCGVPRFVHVGSVATLESGGKDLISEAQYWPQTQPQTAYGHSKFMAQREVWRGRAEGLSVATVFPALILGGGEGQNQAAAGAAANPRLAALRQLAERFPHYYPTGGHGFVAAADVAAAILRILERGQNDDRFVLSAVNWSYRELLATFAAAAARPAPDRPLSPRLLRWFGRWERWRGGAQAALLSPDLIRLAQTTLRFDGGRAVRELGLHYTDPRDLLLS